MCGKLDFTSKHLVFQPLRENLEWGMRWAKLWRGWHQIIGGDIYPPSPPGFAPLSTAYASQVFPVSSFLPNTSTREEVQS